MEVKQTQQNKKLEYIARIFHEYLKTNPNRPLEWYGETFDKLYDKDEHRLWVILTVKSNEVLK